MLTTEVTSDTITGRNIPLVNPVNVTSLVLPTGLTVIDAPENGSINSPIYIAADFIFSIGNDLIVSTLVANSGWFKYCAMF